MSYNKLPLVKWRPNGPKRVWKKDDDDFIFQYGKYRLRVEQMDKGYWWWGVYFDEIPAIGDNTLYGNEVEFNDPHASTCEQAMAFAEAGFYSHLISENK